MRQFLILSCWMVFSFSTGFSQEDVIKTTRHEVDSIMNLIDREKNPEKRFTLILSIYDTRVEGYPLLILETFQKLLVIAKKDNDIVAESNAYSFAGQGYRLSASYVQALEYHHKAIALAEQSGIPYVLGWAQNQIGHIYKDREENDKAISFYKLAWKNTRTAKDDILEGWPLMNLAAVYLNNNQPDSSLYYGNLSYEKIVAVKGFVTQSSYIFANIASAYSKKGDQANATEYFRRALNSANESLSPRYLGIVYVALAEHFQRNNQIDSCTFYAKKAIAAVQNTLFSYMSIKPSKMLTDIYENTNADSTLKYLKIYRTANDSLYSTRANQQLQMMTFEEDMRQRNIETEKISYQNKIRTNVLIGVMAAILAIAIILYRNNLHRKKANIVLEKTLTELKATQSQLVQSEKMASLGELTAGIAHEIQNPLNFVNNFSEINAEMLDEANDAINKGDIDELKQILIDVKDNSAGYEKIKQSFNCVPIGKHVLKNKSAEMMLYEVLD